MELTARDIHEKQFHDAWRGYNQEEVDDFLDRVAEVFDLLRRENTAVHNRVRELEQALSTSRETEEMLKKTLVSAQQAAEEAIAKAQEKANAIVTEAEERANRANEETRQRLAGTEAEIRRRMLDSDREHTARRREFETTVERLRAFEVELKGRLQTFLEQQTRSLETLNDADAPTERAPAGPGERLGEAPEGDPEEPGATSQEARRVELDNGAPDGAVRLDEPEPAGPQRRGVRGLFTRDEG
jgi:cell division initiation protein